MGLLGYIQEYLDNFSSRKSRFGASHTERFLTRIQQSFSYRRISWQILWIGELGWILPAVIVEQADVIDAALENRVGEAERRCANTLVSKCRSLAPSKGATDGSLYSVIGKRRPSHAPPSSRQGWKIESSVVIDSGVSVGG